MRIRLGYTRIVICYRNKAYKIFRLRPLRPFIRLTELLCNRGVTAQLQTYDQSFLKAVAKYLGAGIVANRLEYWLWNQYQHSDLAPVHTMWCAGLVLVQERGQPLASADMLAVKRHFFWPAMLEEKHDNPIGAVAQFANFDGKIKLVDYGSEPTRRIIESRNVAA